MAVGETVAELRRGEIVSNRYQVSEPIAEGDRRVTYLARDTRLDRTVVLSVVRPECIHLDPRGVEREAKVLGRIGSHDNIVSVLDAETRGEAQFVVFDYLSGGTLADHIAKEGPLPLGSLLRLGRQVCRGLAHLHDNGLIHRDVAAKNVLLDDRGEAHLGDFDSAVRLEDFGSGYVPITPNVFAAPEERNLKGVDFRSDLYSFGCLLHVMALGGDELGPADKLRNERTDLPTSFADLVERLLAESPDDRAENAQAVLAWLEDIRQASNIDALIGGGETQQVEFKASLHHPYDPLPEGLRKQVAQGKLSRAEARKKWEQGLAAKNVSPEQALRELQRVLNWEVTKSIAAFLNSEGGILLIGVSDNGQVLGIEADFHYVGGESTDAWLLSLQQVIINALNADAFSVVRTSLVQHGDVHVAVVSAPARPTETWHGKPGEEVFYVRAGNGTRQLTGPEMLTYIREHWPK